ncbi:hypothetical protein [Paraburkholderia atlantica]|uniref:Uncharacterized protein n=1 Tax=Paraburkholderia atlantica TaxID=2654982 RepID=D5WDP7_PARAM|nr:hypothetical protein [Paraburkholderia atlantica]ADG18850.1 hypothetical protein BC1002_4893 [Paraburkholderia atlantica]MBB5505093.1 hypothetical protein [Paraburkholderia atlantica]
MSTPAQIARHFDAFAGLIGLHVNGLNGLAIYSDSQFRLGWKRSEFPDSLQPAARKAFLQAIHRRVVDEFPNHPLTRFSRDYLAKADDKISA